DGKAGPAAPKLLWAVKSQDQFIAAPVPLGDRLVVSGFGAFNVSTFSVLSTDPKAAERVAWSKTTPYLKLPTVSSPAVADGKLVFGDGMHQTDGATLHCLRADTGLPLWQLPVPGSLVHLEGSPTVEKGRVYLGGGAAGVLCVDMNRVTLEGKEMDLAAIQKLLDAKWAALMKKYQEDLKKDPDFAVKPTEDQLPKPSPLKVWEQGKEKWHVDAPVAVAGDRVLAASAFLEHEKVGDRVLFCLDAKTGEVKWRTPLAQNPWGGPTVTGDLVIVGGSNIRFDPKTLSGAQGEVAAYKLADGKEVWRKELKAGVLSCAAVADGLAVVTATDGKVRAYEVKSGELRWHYDGKAPFFAAPAVAGGVVYAGDLKGVLHAVGLADGKEKWTLQVPGMFYGGPVVAGGRIYAATCNLEGPNAGKPTAVVCVGEK
ncbi:MAG TPA: PQQ-binding-like beta-propeller repeat protein, partial [Gemmataceae bacterium]|nr:PQQ-binding-like beta-propeller repeat protein [Gemmataceae bacterium]